MTKTKAPKSKRTSVRVQHRGKGRSTFEFWFESQHGKRPFAYKDTEKLREEVRKGLLAESLLRKGELYDQRRTSALYAWSARDHNDAKIVKACEGVTHGVA